MARNDAQLMRIPLGGIPVTGRRGMSSSEDGRLSALSIASKRADDLAVALDGGVEVRSDHGWPAALVCAFFSVRTSRALSAVVSLCSNSFGVESQSLLRSMLQDLVDVRYIATDPEPLSEQWRIHESRRRYYTYMMRKELQDMEQPDDFDELQAIIDQDWVEAREIAATKKHKQLANVSRRDARGFLLKDRWARLNIHETAKRANYKYPDTFKLFEWYPYLCEHAHGSPGLAGDYLQKTDAQIYIKDYRDSRFKSASMAISALVYAHATFVGLRDIGLKYDPDPLIEDMPVEDVDFGDL